MYNEYFGLTDRPFSIAPDPRYLYMSDQHREALAHLTYGVQQEGGFILLTGEVGTGKTTVCRCFLKQLNDQIDVAYIVNPKQTSVELLGSMCDDLGIQRSQSTDSIKSLTDGITQRLLENHAKGKNTVLLIDEAQNLSVEVLEQLRLLTNLETDQKKLLQIILLGQPELLDLLAKPELRQLSQRVTARFHMDQLDREDIIPYVQHRLAVAGCRMSLFPKSTAKVIEQASNGVPRLINLICDRALLGVYSRNESTVSVQTLKKAAKEVLGEQKKANGTSKPSYFWGLVSAVLLIQCVAVLVWLFYPKAQAPVSTQIAVQTSNNQVEQPSSSEQLLSSEQTGSPLNLNDEKAVEESLSSNTTLKLEAQNESVLRFFNLDAYEGLASLWGIQGLPNNWMSLCRELAQTRLGCSSGNYDWQKFISINRPAVATLIYQGQLHRVLVSQVLTESGSDDVQLTVVSAEGAQYVMSRTLFDQLWSGQLEYLWLQPVANMPVLRPGDAHDYVQVVRSFLKGQSGSTVYDLALSDDIKQFQMNHQIISDGVIGPETIMLINTLNREVPLLRSESLDEAPMNQDSINSKTLSPMTDAQWYGGQG